MGEGYKDGQEPAPTHLQEIVVRPVLEGAWKQGNATKGHAPVRNYSITMNRQQTERNVKALFKRFQHLTNIRSTNIERMLG